MTIAEDTRDLRESSFGWMIQRITGALNRKMTARLAEHDMSLPSFAVMMTVLEHMPMMQTEIAKHFEMPAYAISRAVDALEKLGYVERLAHESSRRAHRVQATKAGLALAPQLHAIVREVNTELAADLAEEERQIFSGLLRRLLPARDI